MEKDILWDKNIDILLCSFSYNQVDNFLNALDYSDMYKATMFIAEDNYESAELWEWLSTKDDYELNDVKRELQKWIVKSEKIPEEQYEEKIANIGENIQSKILLAGGGDSEFEFCTLQEYLDAIRLYLAMEKKDSFSKDMIECFPNLYFVSDIESTLNTLNRSFSEIKEEIIQHLRALDDYKDKFLLLEREGKSNREISLQFKGDTGINCSPQSDRDGTVNLRVTLYNDITKSNEEIVCELHTKFNKFNIDRTKQDRIYFSPGKPGVQDGRTIIKHIGTHL